MSWKDTTNNVSADNEAAALYTFSYTGKVVIVSFHYLLSGSLPFVGMMLQHNRFVCGETAENMTPTTSDHQLEKLIHQSGGEKILTGGFDLFLCGSVPQVWEAQDRIVILILTYRRQDKG